MDKESWDALQVLYLSERHSLTKQKEEMLKEEFSAEELRIKESYVKQVHNAEKSPAYGSKERKAKAMTASEVAYNHANSLISAKIEQREYEIEQKIIKHLDKIYEFNGGSRQQAELDHNAWLEQQARERTKADSAQIDSRQYTKEEKNVDQSQNLSEGIGMTNPTVTESFNEVGLADKGMDLDK